MNKANSNWTITSFGQIKDGKYQTVLWNKAEKIALIKFTDAGIYVSCEEKEFKDPDFKTIDILSNFSGHITRITKHKKIKDPKVLKVETENDITTLKFCTDIGKINL